MKSCDIHVFALLTLAISTTLAELWLQESSNGESSDDSGAGRLFESAVLCSEAGNCTCLFAKPHVIVKCTSTGDKLDKILSELPETTTQMWVGENLKTLSIPFIYHVHVVHVNVLDIILYFIKKLP